MSMVKFYWDESGATTVDWVVITAAVVGICIAVLTTVGTASHDHGETVGSAMSSQGVKSY